MNSIPILPLSGVDHLQTKNYLTCPIQVCEVNVKTKNCSIKPTLNYLSFRSTTPKKIKLVPKSSSLLCYTASSLHHIATDTQTTKLLRFLKPSVLFPLNHVCFFCFQRINFDEINLHNSFKTFFLPQARKI